MRKSHANWALFLASCGFWLSSCHGSGPAEPPPKSTEIVERTPLRRLTKAQYDNAIRDLLGIDAHPGADFTEDERVAGFAANARLPVQGIQLDQYDEAAADLAAQAVAHHLDQILPCELAAGPVCGEQFVASFGARAFRRPLRAAELKRYRDAFQSVATTGSATDAVELVVRAMLQSPHFLYQVEVGDATRRPEADGATPLSSYELASRLSFLLWNSMPDGALFAAAAANQLQTTAQIEGTARSMLKDPKAREGLASFHRQWLGIEALPVVYKDGDVFGTFNAALRDAMAEEATDFIDDVLRRGDGRLETLLSAPYSIISGPLYVHYGLPEPNDPSVPTRVQLPADQRAGVLTLPAVMTTHAHEDQTSIVHRGILVRQQLLCQEVPSPPPDVDTSLPQVDPSVSWRRQFEQHRANASCNGCHALLDPLGNTFENYDPIGRYRTLDGTQPVDSSGEVTQTPGSDGPVANAVDLAHHLATSEDVRQCLVEQWFRYAFARPQSDASAGTLAAVMGPFRDSDFQIAELLVAITRTRNFRYLLP